MNRLISFITMLIFTVTLQGQDFLWANSYEITNTNEVAAFAADTNDFIYITGVHEDDVFLPYTGDCYITKSNQDGEALWTEYIYGELQIGDMAGTDDGVIIIGQSTGSFTYQGESFGSTEYFLFVIKIDGEGNLLWHVTDDTKRGANTNLNITKSGNVILHVRGQYNLGDWLWKMDADGNILSIKEIYADATTIVSMDEYNDWVFLNGGYNGLASFMIDDIIISTPPIEGATFTLALNQDLVAQWVAIDTTINNHDGRIVANSAGIFVFETVLQPGFVFQNVMKKFNFEGERLLEIPAPTFTSAVASYPDMVITPAYVGLFVHNDFNFNSHAVFLFDHYLNLVSEKYINGPSDLYSGQIGNIGDDIFVSHVCSGDLNFNDEMLLPYSGTGKQAYIAKIGNSSTIGFLENKSQPQEFLIYPNPASDWVTIDFINPAFDNSILRISDVNGNIVTNKTDGNTTIDVSQLVTGIYFIQAIQPNGKTAFGKVLIK